MYLRSFLCGLCLLLSVIPAKAQQTFTINGFVKDSLAAPVVSATISIVTKNGSGVAFTKTDQKGFFTSTVSNDSLSVKVTAMGYQQLIFPLPEYTGKALTIVLKKATAVLKEVNITSQRKVSLTSDTLMYHVKSFKEPNDRVIADLIGRLPGIKIDDKGAISYNGKAISKVYIDGDNLMDGRYRLATNNVPVNAVEQVQVIERDQPVKALNGYVVTNNVSLNLKLTDSARAITINTAQVGAGNKAYSAEINNLILKPKIKSINSLKTNNIGENLERENADLGGSSGHELSLKSPNPYLAISSADPPTLAEKYYLKNNDNSININGLFKLQSDWTLRLNVATLQLKRKYNFNNSISYFINNDTIGYNEIQNHQHKLNQWQIQAQIEKNSKALYVKSLTRLDLPTWDKSGTTIQNGEKLAQYLPSSYLSLSNETNVVKAIGANNILQYNSTLQYYKLNENLKISPGIQKDILNENRDYLMLDQQVYTKNIFVNQSLTFKTKFNNLVLSASIGGSFERNRLNSNLYKTDSLGAEESVGDQYKNEISFNNLGLFGKASVIYLIKNGSLSLEASPAFSFIDYAGPTKPINKNSYFQLNPTVDFRKNLGRYSEFSFKYFQQTTFGAVADIYGGTILTNYRKLNFNESPLPKTDLDGLSFRYSYRKPITMLFYNLNFSYDRTGQNFINAFEINQGLTKSKAIDYNNKTHKYALYGNVSKYLFFISTNLSATANVSLQQGYNFYNEEISPFSVRNINVSATARKKLLSVISVSVTAETGKFTNVQKAGNGDLRNTTDIRTLKTEWQHNITPTFSYNLAYSLTSYKQSLQQKVNNSFLDANIKYAPTQWKGFFELQCINLINRKSYEQVNADANQLSMFNVPLRERTLLLKYLFTF